MAEVVIDLRRGIWVNSQFGAVRCASTIQARNLAKALTEVEKLVPDGSYICLRLPFTPQEPRIEGISAPEVSDFK